MKWTEWLYVNQTYNGWKYSQLCMARVKNIQAMFVGKTVKEGSKKMNEGVNE